MLILGIETSCDETAVSVVEDGSTILSNVLASQEDIHSVFGGIVPELACRRHINVIDLIVNKALVEASIQPSDLSAIAVTHGPGLMGALLVGLSFAKAMAYRWNLDLLPTNHLAGHLSACRLEPGLIRQLAFPVIGLVVSGGHTNLYLMKSFVEVKLLGGTVDDSAGEAFDKGAKMLGLGYPGGPIIDQLSKAGDPKAIHFPRSNPSKGPYNFSFSGLKTALKYYLQKQGRSISSEQISDISASYQEAIIDVLVSKSLKAIDHYGASGILVSGGVAANSALRARFVDRLEGSGRQTIIPRPGLCTDNGAMIAAAAFIRYHPGEMIPFPFALSPQAHLPL